MAPDSYDVAVIGAGPGGYVAAIRAGQLGLKTCIIEEGELGGVCLNVGCIPSKAIISTGKQVKAANKGGRGISFGSVDVHMPDVIKHKDGVVKQLTTGVGGLLKGNKVTILSGRATLVGKDSIKVTGKDAGTVKAKHIILATGSSTIEIPGFAFDEKRVLSSTGALELQEVPEHLVVIGGGVIGLELGCAYSNLGTGKVTVIEMMEQVVPGVDGEVAKALGRSLKKKGFDVHLGARAKAAKPGKSGVAVTFDDAKGTEHSVDASHCLVSVGRRPNTKNLGLEKAGVSLDERGFLVTDAQGRTNVPTIFAIGDITHGPMLAHKASKEGVVAAEAIAGDKGAAKDWKTVPGVIFTDPEIATAGHTEEQLKQANIPYKVGKFNVGALGKALADGETDGFYKVLGHAETDEVLGVHIIGPHASDLISEAALALEMAATVEDIGLTIHPHPTLGEGLMEAAEALHKKSPHAINR